jgi:phosphopantothenoylcysteine decarboxylase
MDKAATTVVAKEGTMTKTARRPRVLLCFAGSVATVKVPELTFLLSEFADVRLVCSSSAAMHFLDRAHVYNPINWQNFEKLGGKELIIDDSLEWISWDKIGDPVIHIELRRWADLVLVAPASADILAKLSVGISDTLLLSCLRAWDFKKGPAIVCPAMNTMMWEHPATASALRILESWGYDVVLPATKRLACNDVGSGALAPVVEIVAAVREGLKDKMSAADPDFFFAASKTQSVKSLKTSLGPSDRWALGILTLAGFIFVSVDGLIQLLSSQ